MKIHVLASDGSQLGVTTNTVLGHDPHQLGVGGAELGILTLCDLWKTNGHEVSLYNNPRTPTGSKFEQLPVGMFNPDEDRDILIVFRTPYSKVSLCKGKKIWLSTDQYTSKPFAGYDKLVDAVVCISKFHADYFKSTYGINDTHIIPFPVRTFEILNSTIDKVTNRFIFTSVPDRGLQHLWRMWPKILKEVPDASLVITSDYRLWGAGSPLDSKHRTRWFVHDNVIYRGALPRYDMLNELLQAEIMLYPCEYDELQCIAVAEAQVARVLPITSSCGALSTTNKGIVLDLDARDPRNDNKFIDVTLEIINSPKLKLDRTREAQQRALSEFYPHVAMQRWDEVFNG